MDCFNCNAIVGIDKLSCPANQTENVETWKKGFKKYGKSLGKWCQILVKKDDGSIISQVKMNKIFKQ